MAPQSREAACIVARIALLLVAAATIRLGGNDGLRPAEENYDDNSCSVSVRLRLSGNDHNRYDTLFYVLERPVCTERQGLDAPITLGFEQMAKRQAYIAAVAEAEERALLQGLWQGAALGYGQPYLLVVPGSAAEIGGGNDQGSAETLFIQGYRDFGGRPEWESVFIDIVIPCESTWNRFAVSPEGHLGLAQFHQDTWLRAGGGDWADPYQQGVNVARWSNQVHPAGQWGCWPG